MALLDRLINRGKEKEKMWEDYDGLKAESQILGEVRRIWSFLQLSRRRLEYEWFVNDMHYYNDRYLAYNAGVRRVQTVSVEKMMDRLVINLGKQYARAIVNFLNVDHPNVGVRPGNQTDNDFLRAKREKYALDYWYRHLKLNEEFKKASLDGTKGTIGWVKVLWDKDALSPTSPFTNDDGKKTTHTYGQLVVKRCDPFEIYWDPMASGKDDMRYISQAVVRTLAELKSNNLYENTDKLAADQKLSSSIVKAAEIRVLTANAANQSMGQPNDMDTVLTIELFRKVYNKEAKEWQTWLTTFTETGILLRHQKWDMNEFPFEYYIPEVVGKLNESRGCLHDLREPVRVINDMVSQINESARVMGKLNWLIPKGSNIGVIEDKTGQFIEYEVVPGGRPEQAQALNLPSYIMQFVSVLRSFAEDVVGIHGGVQGKAPFAQASGDLVDTLNEGDENNLSIMRDNMDDFVNRTAKLELKTFKQNGTSSSRFPTTEKDELGQIRYMDLDPKDVDTNDDLEISTGSKMPYSTSQQNQMFMNLWKEKAIQDANVLFRLLEMPDLDTSMGDEEPHIARQIKEIQDILDGKEVDDPQVFENHQVHIKTLDNFCNSERWPDLDPDQQQKLLDHRSKHITLSIQLAEIAASMQVEPIKRSITLMERMNKMSDTTAIERDNLFKKFGIQSDAAQVQFRGGLAIQDPAQAEQQAMAEDNEMLEERPVQVSYADNHVVHLQTHGPVFDMIKKNIAAQQKGLPVKQTVSQVTFEIMQQHIKDHIQSMLATQVAPGLVPNDQSSQPPQPSLKNTGPANQAPVNMSKQAQQAQSQQQAQPMPNQPKSKSNKKSSKATK